MIGTVEAAVEQMRNLRSLYVATLKFAVAELENAGRSEAAMRVRGYIEVMEHQQAVRRRRWQRRSDHARRHRRQVAA